MVRCKTPLLVPPPKHIECQTDIRAPRVRTNWVNGRAQYTFIPPKIGATRILDWDDEDDIKPVITQSITPRIKHEHSHHPSRSLGQSQSEEFHPRVKREASTSGSGGRGGNGGSSSLTDLDRHKYPRSMLQSHGDVNGASPGVSSTDSSSSLALDSETTSSSSSSDSETDESSSSSDDSDFGTYKPSIPPSRFSSTSPRTRQQSGAARVKPVPISASPEPMVAKESPSRNDKTSMSQASPEGASSAKGNHRTQSWSRCSGRKSPRILGFQPINRELPPANAPTEPRAMRTANTKLRGPTGPVPEKRKQNSSEPGKWSSGLTLHGLPPAGVRPLGSTRPELGIQQTSNTASRAVRADLTELRLMSASQKRPHISSSLSQPWKRVDPPGQSSSTSSFSSRPRHEQSGGPITGSSTTSPPHKVHNSARSQKDSPSSQTIHSRDVLPNSTPGKQTNTSQKYDNALHSPGQRQNESNNHKRHKSKQRRGPARLGRIMQTIEHPGMEVSLSPVTPPMRGAYQPRPYQPATPGPSSLSRGAPSHPQSSPGLFATTRTPPTPFHSRPFASSPNRTPVSRGKRPRDEAWDLDPATQKAELERVMQRIRNHETDMEKTRDQLEKTNRLLADQQRRIDELQRQQCRRLGGQRQHDRSLEAGSSSSGQCESETRRQHSHQNGARQQGMGQRHRNSDPQSPAEPNGLSSVAAAQHSSEGPSNPIPTTSESQKASQKRLKRKVLERPLSGHNPKLIFDDEDRPNVSEATVFLLRLSQQEVLDRFSRHIKDKDFFDLKHSHFKSIGCWVISGEASYDYKMKVWDKGEKHTFSFRRLAIRLWHDEYSMYSLLQGKNHQKAIQVCLNEHCMNPDHIEVESSKESAERRRCKKMRRCTGHVTFHKDGTIQKRRSCIFPP